MILTTIRTIMMAVVLLCTIVGLATPFATAKKFMPHGEFSATDVESSFKFQGAEVGGEGIDYSVLEKYTFCGAVTVNNFQYAFAFAVVAVIFNVLTIVVLLVSTCVFKVKGMYRTINVIMPVITCVFLIMASGCAFIYLNASFDKCHTKLSDIFPDITPGTSAVMLTMATILCFIASVFSAIFDIMIWGVETFSNAPIKHLEEDDVYKPGANFSPIEARLLPAPQPDEMMKDGISIDDDNSTMVTRSDPMRTTTTKESGSMDTGSASGDMSGSASGDASGTATASMSGSGSEDGSGSGSASDDDSYEESDEY